MSNVNTGSPFKDSGTAIPVSLHASRTSSIELKKSDFASATVSPTPMSVMVSSVVLYAIYVPSFCFSIVTFILLLLVLLVFTERESGIKTRFPFSACSSSRGALLATNGVLKGLSFRCFCLHRCRVGFHVLKTQIRFQSPSFSSLSSSLQQKFEKVDMSRLNHDANI